SGASLPSTPQGCHPRVAPDGSGRRRRRSLPGQRCRPSIAAMPDPLSREDVRHVATLARLDLDDDALDRYAGQLSAILGHAADIAALDLDDVPATAHPLPLVNVLRDDVVGEVFDRAEVLAMAPDSDGVYFRVPKILGEAP